MTNTFLPFYFFLSKVKVEPPSGLKRPTTRNKNNPLEDDDDDDGNFVDMNAVCAKSSFVFGFALSLTLFSSLVSTWLIPRNVNERLRL